MSVSLYGAGLQIIDPTPLSKMAGWFLDESERQYGQANHSYTEYMLERLELSLATCSDILNQIQPIAEFEEYDMS